MIKVGKNLLTSINQTILRIAISNTTKIISLTILTTHIKIFIITNRLYCHIHLQWRNKQVFKEKDSLLQSHQNHLITHLLRWSILNNISGNRNNLINLLLINCPYRKLTTTITITNKKADKKDYSLKLIKRSHSKEILSALDISNSK